MIFQFLSCRILICFGQVRASSFVTKLARLGNLGKCKLSQPEYQILTSEYRQLGWLWTICISSDNLIMNFYIQRQYRGVAKMSKVTPVDGNLWWYCLCKVIAKSTVYWNIEQVTDFLRTVYYSRRSMNIEVSVEEILALTEHITKKIFLQSAPIIERDMSWDLMTSHYNQPAYSHRIAEILWPILSGLHIWDLWLGCERSQFEIGTRNDFCSFFCILSIIFLFVLTWEHIVC